MITASLRVRLLLGTLVWIAASLVFAGWGLGRLFQDHVTAQFHAQLQIHLDQLTAQLDLDPKGRPFVGQRSSDPRFDTPFSGLYWQIDRLAGKGVSALSVGLRSRSLWDQVLVVPPDAIVSGQIHRHRIQGPQGAMLGVVERSVELEGRALRLIVAADERLLREPVSRFEGQLWLALAVLGTGLAVAAWIQVLVGLAPLRGMRIALGRVRDGRTQRMEGTFPTEIMPLVTEFNHVLAQNAEVVERARTQAGNLAHALKTPLTVLANAANVPNRGGDDLARLVRTQVQSARKQVDYHLAQAKTAAAVQSTRMRTEFAPTAEGLLRTMRRIHATRALSLVVHAAEEGLAFRGEQHDLQEMLGNLLDNACKWTATRVDLGARRKGDRLIVVVDDDGKGIPPEQRTAMMRRGVRADEDVPGTGLGLAIVADLARMYGGELALDESPWGGLSARLTLPAA